MRNFVKTLAIITIPVFLFGCARTYRNRTTTPDLNPDLQAPNSMLPGTTAPGTTTPGTVPGTTNRGMIPGTRTPGTNVPGTPGMPGNRVPNTVVPGTNVPGTTPRTTTAKPSVGGLYLGDSIKEVKAAFGSDYRTITVKDTALLGEPYLKLSYNKTTILVGKNSGKVYQIETTDNKLATNFNIKVGDTYQSVSTKLAGMGMTNNTFGGATKGVNTNWYKMADNSVLVVSFSGSTNANTRTNVTGTRNTAKVKMIRLTYQNLMK